MSGVMHGLHLGLQAQAGMHVPPTLCRVPLQPNCRSPNIILGIARLHCVMPTITKYLFERSDYRAAGAQTTAL